MVKEIYDNAMEFAKKKCATNNIHCLKLKLEQDIGEDKDKLLLYKIKCVKKSDYASTSFAISTATLLATILSIILTITVKNITIDESFIMLLSMLVLYTIIVAVMSIKQLRYSEKYKTILMVLESIEKDKKW